MTRLGEKLPVEPLSDERVARIEDRVMLGYANASALAEMRPPFPWLRRVGLPAMAVAMAAAVLLLVWPKAPAIRPVSIATDAAGGSTLTIGDARIALAPATEIALTHEDSGAVEVALERGQVSCEVMPRGSRPPFVVVAGEVTVTVVGTAFDVRRDEAVHVAVRHGKVRVDSPDGTVYVSAGESWPATSTELAAVPMQAQTPAQVQAQTPAQMQAQAHAQIQAQAHAQVRAETQAQQHAQVPEGTSGTGLAQSGTGSRPQAGNSGDSGRPEMSTAGSGALRGHVARAPEAGSSRPRSRGQGQASGRDAELQLLQAARPMRAAPPVEAEPALAEILELEGRDPREALRRYQALALRRGPEAAFAMYSAAYVQYFRLKARADALQTLVHYERRFPRGEEAESVLWLRIRILCEGDDRRTCRAAAHGYLNRFPQGNHAALASKIVHWDM